MSSTKTLLTADELELMPDVDSVLHELDEGELIEMPPAGWQHGRCAVRIITILETFARAHKLGYVYSPDTGFRLKDDTVRAPDVAFMRRKQIAETGVRGYIIGAPDLAVEVFSPSDRVRQLMRKVKQYFAAGTHTVWIVYPELKQVNVLEATGTDRLLENDDPIEAPELLPGFSVPISEFFE
jgi:Uma2 family endonuclease